MRTDREMQRRRLQITDSIPEADWCDLRVEYMIDGKTVAEIANDRGCEVRTVSRLIRENRNFSEFGKKRMETKMSGFEALIEQALKSELFTDTLQITVVSKALYALICKAGYQGSERTLRNYLQTIPWTDWVTGTDAGIMSSGSGGRDSGSEGTILAPDKGRG